MAGELERKVRAVYDALNRRDLDAALADAHPDLVSKSLVMEAEARVYRGHEGGRQFMEDLLEVFPDWHGEVVQVEEIGDCAIVKVRVGGHAAASGVAVDQHAWLATRVEDGLFIEWHFVRSEEEARAYIVPRS